MKFRRLAQEIADLKEDAAAGTLAGLAARYATCAADVAALKPDSPEAEQAVAAARDARAEADRLIPALQERLRKFGKGA